LAVDESQKGKTYAPFEYEIGREKIREYANAVGEFNPVHHDRKAAQAAGFRDVVAPPMFAVVFSTGSVAPAILDPEVGIDFARMVHGGQAFRWGPPVVAGDEITTECECMDVSERAGLAYFVFETRSNNQRAERVCTGTWTNIVRRPDA
jgi:acyl dehydratase